MVTGLLLFLNLDANNIPNTITHTHSIITVLGYILLTWIDNTTIGFVTFDPVTDSNLTVSP
jgi:hypothetical protein